MSHVHHLKTPRSLAENTATPEHLVAEAEAAMHYGVSHHHQNGHLNLSESLRLYRRYSFYINEKQYHEITPREKNMCSDASDNGASLLAKILSESLRHMIPRTATPRQPEGTVHQLFSGYSETLGNLSVTAQNLYASLYQLHQEQKALDDSKKRAVFAQKALKKYEKNAAPLLAESTKIIAELHTHVQQLVQNYNERYSESGKAQTPDTAQAYTQTMEAHILDHCVANLSALDTMMSHIRTHQKALGKQTQRG